MNSVKACLAALGSPVWKRYVEYINSGRVWRRMCEESACKSAAILEEYNWQTVSRTSWSSMDVSFGFIDKTLWRAERMIDAQSTCMELQKKLTTMSNKSKTWTRGSIGAEKNSDKPVNIRVMIFLLIIGAIVIRSSSSIRYSSSRLTTLCGTCRLSDQGAFSMSFLLMLDEFDRIRLRTGIARARSGQNFCKRALTIPAASYSQPPDVGAQMFYNSLICRYALFVDFGLCSSMFKLDGGQLALHRAIEACKRSPRHLHGSVQLRLLLACWRKQVR